MSQREVEVRGKENQVFSNREDSHSLYKSKGTAGLKEKQREDT